MAVGTLQVGVPVALAASGNVAGAGTALSGAQAESATSGQATILGFFVVSGTTPSVKLTNIAAGGGAGATIYLNTAVAPTVPAFYPFPLTVPSGGIYATLAGTNPVVTFLVAE